MKRNVITISKGQDLADGLEALERSAIGIVALVDDEGKFSRTVTDGDLRRLLLAGKTLESSLNELPEITSVIASETMSPAQFLMRMNESVVDQLPVVDKNGRPVSIVLRRDVDNPILLSTPHLGGEEVDFVMEAFETNWIAPLGPNVDGFEKEMATYLGIDDACALASGTAAIHLGLRLLGVTAGDSVFVSDFTFIGSVGPIIYQGAEPVFIDSELTSWNMCPLALEKALNEAQNANRLPKAIIVVNLYGQSADMDPIIELSEKFGVPILEDAAESLGASYKGRASGTMGTFGVFSFNGNKIITTSGGGMLIGHDSNQIKRARSLASQAREPVPYFEHEEVGYNYRMSNILAGIGRGQLKVIDERITRRREINDLYKQGLSHIDHLHWMPEPEWSYSNRWLSCATLSSTDERFSAIELIKWLSERQIEARHLWKPMHMQPVFKGKELQTVTQNGTSVAKQLFQTGLCFPSGSNMTADDVEKVVDETKAFFSA